MSTGSAPARGRAYTAPVRFATDGVFRLDYRARKDGLPSAGRSLELKVDQTVPATTAALEGVTSGGTFTGAVRLTLAATDATSGVARTEWRLAGESAQAYTAAVTLPAAAGERTIEYRSLDAAGNAEPWKRASFRSPSGTVPQVALEWPAANAVVPASGRDAVPRGRGRSRGRSLRRCDGAVAQRHRPVAGTASGCTGTIVAPRRRPTCARWTLEATYTADAGTGDHVPLIRGTPRSAPADPQAGRALRHRRRRPHREHGRHARRRAERRLHPHRPGAQLLRREPQGHQRDPTAAGDEHHRRHGRDPQEVGHRRVAGSARP